MRFSLALVNLFTALSVLATDTLILGCPSELIEETSEKYLFFIDSSSLAATLKDAFKLLESRVEADSANSAEEILQFLKQFKEQLSINNTSELRYVLIAGIDDDTKKGLIKLLDGLIGLERSEAQNDCTVDKQKVLLAVIEIYGGFHHFCLLHDDDGLFVGNGCHLHHDYCGVKLIRFLKHYGRHHISQCLQRIPARFGNSFLLNSYELEAELDNIFSSITTDESTSEISLLTALKNFSFHRNKYDARLMYRKSGLPEHESNTYKTGKFFGKLNDICTRILRHGSSIFNLYNIARAIAREETQQLLTTNMSSLNQFLKHNEYNRICHELQHPGMRKQIYTRFKSILQRQKSGIMSKFISGCLNGGSCLVD